MKLLRVVFGGIRSLWRKDQHDQELDEELRSYLEASTQDKMRRGMGYAEAMRAARLEMGSMTAIKQEVRASGWESAVDSLWQDLRYGVRQLLGSPGFSAVAILTLALGIGANTAIFTLVHAVMLKPLPVSNPEQLYRVGDGDLCCEWGALQESWGIFEYAYYKHLRDTDSGFEEIAAFSGNTPSFNVRRAGSVEAAQTINGEYVSGNYFQTFGLHASGGRLLRTEDDQPEAPAVAVMSHRAWRQHYAADPTIIGSTLLLNDVPVTLVGIAPAEYEGARLTSDPPALWIPLHQQPMFSGQGTKSILHSSGMAWLYVVGRLRPGVRPELIQSRLSGDLQQWLRAEGRQEDAQHQIAHKHIQVTPVGTGISSFRSNSRLGMYLLSAASLLVLLIACANLANLLIARSAARKQQTALRLSLGATRARLIRTVLTESVLLSVIGGAAGLLLAYMGTKGILLLAFRGASYVPIDATPSLPVLGFALLLSILTGVLFGVAPAWIGTKTRLSKSLRGSSRSATTQSSVPQRTLVILQAALSVVLLAVAGLVVQSLRNLEDVSLGFEPEGRLLATINFKAAGYKPEQLPQLYGQLQERLGSIPGVRGASLSLNSPQHLCCINLNVSIDGRAEPWIEDVNVVFNRVSPRYFETMGTPLLRGRAITERDTTSSRRVAVVDEAFARKFFPGEDAIGRHFGLSLPGHAKDYEIVGVVKDAKYRNPASAQSPMYFLPFTQTVDYEQDGYRRLETGTLYAYTIQMHVAGVPERYQSVLRDALVSIDPNLALINVQSYREQVAVQYNQERLIARLTSLFSLLALLLASVGLYGLTAYDVARRTREIGIRVALGANRSYVLRMVLRGAFLQVCIGLCIGVPLAILCGGLLSQQLYEVGRFDPLVLSSAVSVLLLCAMIAAILPARRAASIAPVDALRME